MRVRVWSVNLRAQVAHHTQASIETPAVSSSNTTKHDRNPKPYTLNPKP